MQITQSLPQRNEICGCRQKDGSRQHGRCPCEEYSQTEVHSEHEHEVANQSVRGVSRILNNMRNPSYIL